MELNSKKLERTSRIVYYSISTILCFFLILLSSIIIADLDTATARPEIANFENKVIMNDLNKKIGTLNVEIENLNTKKGTIEKTIATAKENYANEKQSFDNWVQTRKTLGSPDKDHEVIERAKKLDEFYKVEQDWRSKLNSRQIEIDEKEKKQQEFQKLIDKEYGKAETKYVTKLKIYDLKVFLIRLLFVAPILALGIFFFIRYRRHKFWPLYFGFTLFSLYAFFFGLVPYLPSYGGYVHYTVGIILSVGLGYYAIKTIRQFIATKETELQVSTQERAKNVQKEVAEKALENHFCPSCGKDFIIKKWEFPSINNENDAYKLVTDFCRHCGLELFKNCNKCGNKNFAHLPFCSSCGTKPTTGK
jgi:outer membrane murein-binding lipoprotein Lpp